VGEAIGGEIKEEGKEQDNNVEERPRYGRARHATGEGRVSYGKGKETDLLREAKPSFYRREYSALTESTENIWKMMERITQVAVINILGTRVIS